MKTFAFSAVALAALMASNLFAQQNAPRNERNNQQGQSQQGGQGQNQQGGGQAQPGQTRPAGQQGQTQQTGAQGASQQIEQHAAACLLIGNQEEIAMSEFGIERAESDQVKEFARDMVKEHTKMVSQLRKFTPQQASFELNVQRDPAVNDRNAGRGQGQGQSGQGQGAQGQSGQGQAGQGQAGAGTRSGEATAARATTAGGGMMDQLLMMKRDKAQECLSIHKEMLKEHKGADFDKAFMGAQVAAHISMLAELRSMKGKVSGEFAELVSEGEKTTQQHLDHAKQVMEEVAKSGGSSRGAGGSENRGDRPANQPRGERPAPRREG